MYTGNSAVGVSGIIPPAALHCIDPLKLVGVLDILDSVGFDSVDVWGADDFGVCLEKYGSDPWDRLRTIRKAVKKTRLRLLLGGQSLLGCGVYADDVVDYFVERAVDNGIDVIRAYDALNDPRNLESAAAGRFGIEFEGAIVYAESPAHSVSFFAGYASLLEQMGANAICILDPEHLLGADTAAALFAAVQKSVSIPVRASLLSDSGLHAELDAKIDAFDCLITSEIPYKAIKAAGAHVSERKISELSRLLRKSVDVNAKKEAGKETRAAGSEDEVSAAITRGLGGKKNISDVDCCATRLRCTVIEVDRVDDALLKATGATGVVHKGNGVQVIYGPNVTVIKSNLEDYLETAEDTFAEHERIVISSPITGNAADLATAPDDAFAQKMMGDGAVVTPEDAYVCAPEDGEVAFVFDTKHAIGFVTDSGVSLLIHVGIDTVKLNGEGFEALVETGQMVKKGDPMLKLDLEYLNANAPSMVSPILCTELEENQSIRLIADGAVKAGDPLFEIEIK